VNVYHAILLDDGECVCCVI